MRSDRPPMQRSLWQRANKPGRDRKYQNSDELWNACVDYLEWCVANPIIEVKPHAFQGVITYSEVERIRPMTKLGLYAHLKIAQSAWDRYREDTEFEDGAVSAVCHAVETIMKEQKFACAATDQMNASFIAKELGLTDKQTIDHTSSDGSLKPPTRIELVPVQNDNSTD